MQPELFNSIYCCLSEVNTLITDSLSLELTPVPPPGLFMRADAREKRTGRTSWAKVREGDQKGSTFESCAHQS